MKIKSTFTYITIVIILLVSAIFLGKSFYKQHEVTKFYRPFSYHHKKNIAINYKSFESTINLGAIGDVLIHGRVYNNAVTSDGYDFKPMLKNVKQELKRPDILLANQETVLGGTELGLSSYPSFNSPFEVGDALIDAGVDIVSTANNHTLDRGEQAIMNAINYYERVNLPYVGHFKNNKDKQKLRIINSNGVSVAYLAYTYGTNGIPVPDGKDYLVNLIDKDIMKDEINRAKQKADVVVMSIHWGNEYERYPTNEQKDLAQFLADCGVDIIFGHHSHVLQPMEMLTSNDGRDVFVVYSLGNFLSGQVRDYKDIGGMASINVTKRVDNKGVSIHLEEIAFVPTYVSQLHNYSVVPLKNANEFGLLNANSVYNEIMEHMFQWLAYN